MGVFYDYFAAPSDTVAAAVIDRDAGPGRSGPTVSDRGFFGRRRQRPVGDEQVFPTVGDTGIDPAVQCGTLEELLTGRPYDDIESDPRWAQALAVRDGGERLVLTLTDGLVDALASARPEELTTVAEPWSRTEEFWGAGDPATLAELLLELSAMARDARSKNETLYCWVCV